jgi:hypothetical protein
MQRKVSSRMYTNRGLFVERSDGENESALPKKKIEIKIYS